MIKIAPNPHLVTAAAAFKYQNKYHLLFAWAEGGDLTNFWKTQIPEPTGRSIFWFAEQCHGLASGLDGIHNAKTSVADIENLVPDTRYSTSSPSPQSPTSPHRQHDSQVHGRHGDIKPENILWFKQDHNEHDLGVLKITDFGVTAFHSAKTTQVPAREILCSKTYAAPEYNISDARVSRPFDIWSLGCLYLEFITWILLGNESIDKFASKRMNDKGNRPRFKTDDFFSIVVNIGPLILTRAPEHARVKPSVTHVSQSI